TRADRVDADLPGRQFAGEDPCQGIHRDLRHRIGRWPASAFGFTFLEVREVRVDKRIECGTSQGRIREPGAESRPMYESSPSPLETMTMRPPSGMKGRN